MIRASDHETFRSRGMVRLAGLLPAEKVTRAREVVLSRLGRAGIVRDGAWRLDDLPHSTTRNAGASLVAGLKNRGEIAALIGEEVQQAVLALLDGRPTIPLGGSAQILFTLPNADAWTVPHHVWHLDLPRLPDGGLPGVQVFTFLDTVAPGGGGTLVVAGSHRLLNESRRISSQQVKRRLKREPYFRDLMSAGIPDRLRFVREPGRVGDVELQVVELHGEPGDVYFTDLRLLHTVAPNAAHAPRIMLTHRFVLALLRDAFSG